MRTPTSTRTDVPRAAAAGPAPAAARAHDAAPPPDPSSATTHPSPARVVAERATGGAGRATVLRELRGATPWAPRPLPAGTDGSARVALVQTAATLVSGDDCAIELELLPGAALTVVETGATVAHHVRGGAPARLSVRIRLGDGARLTWLARPLVLGAGCAVVRTTTVELAQTARALLRETIVLGRSGEAPGALRSTLRATHAGRPLLHEQLDSAGLAAAAQPQPAARASAPHDLLRSQVVAGDATVLDTVMLLGERGADLPGSTQLAGAGSLWRALGARAADPDGPALAVADAWA